MALISKIIPNLINGVSQQPDEVRLPSQSAEQINFLSSVVDGLKRRPGTKHIATLLQSPSPGAFVHIINRDRFEKYIVVILNGDIRVFDFAGNEKTVHKPQGVAYLTCSSPIKALQAVTVADYTFVLNKEVVSQVTKPASVGNLVAITQRVQSISVSPLPRGEKLCHGSYEAVIAGRSYKRTSLDGVNSYLTYLASQLTEDLRRPCVVRGFSVDIPLSAGEALYSLVDKSISGSVIPDVGGCLIVDAPGTITSSDTTKTVGYKTETGAAVDPATLPTKEGLLHVRQGDYKTVYNVIVDGVNIATHTTGGTERSEIQTSAIASALFTQITTNSPVDITWTLLDNVIIAKGTNAVRDFSLTVSDSNGDTCIVACKDRVQSFTDLPAKASEGFTIKVAGQQGVAADDYYVVYSEESDGVKTSGTWTETFKKGLDSKPVATTMPHQLISNADGTFTFEQVEWSGRKAGDENTAPDPSFSGLPLQDIFFFKNRLGLLSDENVILSEAGDYFSFYPTTVLQLLDSSPIDIAVTSEKVAILRHAVPFNESLLLFSDQTQFILKSGDTLTAQSVSIDITTRFDASLDAKPVGVGKNVFFATKRGAYSNLREYYVDPDSQVNDAANVGSHCPSYIFGNASRLAGSSTEDMLALLTDASPNTLFIYKYYWQGNEKVQSSWSRWEFSGNIQAVDFVDSNIVVVVERDGKVFLEAMGLSKTIEETSRGFQTELCMDRMIFVASGTAPPWTSADMVAVDKTGNIYDGDRLSQAIDGGVAVKDIFIGVRYRSYYQFSRLVLTDSDQRAAPLVGRLMLRFITLNYVQSGYFQAGIQASTRPPSTISYNGRRLGDINNLTGKVPIDDGQFRVPVMGDAHTATIWIESDSPLPCAFLSAEWEAVYHRHSRRV